MSNLHRIQWIDAQVRAKRYPNSRLIAEHFEISVRQASRDIEYLRYSMGAPLEYSAEKNGYYYTGEAYALPQYFISEEEKRALNYLAERYKTAGSSQATRLAELFTRLTGAEQVTGRDTSALPVYNIDPKAVEIFNSLAQAIDSRHKVKIHYVNSMNETTARIFCPYKLFESGHLNYAVGFCELRQEIRVFRLDRIKRLERAEGTFTVSPFFNEKKYGPEAFFDYKEPFICRIAAEKPVDFGKLKASCGRDEADPGRGTPGRHIYAVEFFSSEEILNVLLSQPGCFTILFPSWLKQKLKDRLQKVFSGNFGKDNICHTHLL